METKESQESLQSRLSFLHLGRLFSSDRDDSSDSDDYLETGLNTTSTAVRTSSVNATSRFSNHFLIIQSQYACKMCSNCPGIKLEPAL